MADSSVGGDVWGKERLICSVCREYYKDPRILPCDDTFCRKCLQGIYDDKQSISATKLTSMACPACARQITIPQIGVSGFPLDLNIRKKKEEFMNKLLDNVGNSREKDDTTKTFLYSPAARRRFDSKQAEEASGRPIGSQRGGQQAGTYGSVPSDGMEFRHSQPPPFSPGSFRRSNMVDGLIRSRRERSPHVSTHTAPSAVPFFAKVGSDPTSPEDPGTYRPFSGSRPARFTQRRRLHEGSRYKSDPGLQGLFSRTNEINPTTEEEGETTLRSPEIPSRDFRTELGPSLDISEPRLEKTPASPESPSNNSENAPPLSSIHGERRSRPRRHVRFMQDEKVSDSTDKLKEHADEKVEAESDPVVAKEQNTVTPKPVLKKEYSDTTRASSVKDSGPDQTVPVKSTVGDDKQTAEKPASPSHHSAKRRFFSSITSSRDPKVTSPTIKSPDQSSGPSSPESGSPTSPTRAAARRIRKRPTIPTSLKTDQSPPSPERRKPSAGSSPDPPKSGSSPTRKFTFPTTNSLPRNHKNSASSVSGQAKEIVMKDSMEGNKKSGISERSSYKTSTQAKGSQSRPPTVETTNVSPTNKSTNKSTLTGDKRSRYTSSTPINKDKVNIQQVNTPRRGKVDQRTDKQEKNAENDTSLHNHDSIVGHVDVVIGSNEKASNDKDRLLDTSSAPQTHPTENHKSSTNTKPHQRHSSKSNFESPTDNSVAPNPPLLTSTPNARIKSEPDRWTASKQPVSCTGANNSHNSPDYTTESCATRLSGHAEGYRARYLSSDTKRETRDTAKSAKAPGLGPQKSTDFPESLLEVEEISVESDSIQQDLNSRLDGSAQDTNNLNNNYKPAGNARLSSTNKPAPKVTAEKSASEQTRYMFEVEELTGGDDVIRQESRITSDSDCVSPSCEEQLLHNLQSELDNGLNNVSTSDSGAVPEIDPKLAKDQTSRNSTEKLVNGSRDAHLNGQEKVESENFTQSSQADCSHMPSAEPYIPEEQVHRENGSDNMTKSSEEPVAPGTKAAFERQVSLTDQSGETSEDETMTPENPIYSSDSVWQIEKVDYEMPTSVVVLSNGNTVVAEFNSGVIQYFDESGKFLYDTSGVKPFCIATNKADHVIVADRKTKSIRIFDEYGSDVTQWKNDCFKWISGIACLSDGNFVIYDRDKYKVGIYDQSGEKVSEFGSYGERDTQLCMADFLTVNSLDQIILCDSGNHCIKVFDCKGGFIRKFGTRGHGNGQMEWPKGICCDSQDNIIVADNRNNRVSLYSPEGEFIQHLVKNFPNPFGVFLSKSNLLGVTHYSLAGASQLALYKIDELVREV